VHAGLDWDKSCTLVKTRGSEAKAKTTHPFSFLLLVTHFSLLYNPPNFSINFSLPFYCIFLPPLSFFSSPPILIPPPVPPSSHFPLIGLLLSLYFFLLPCVGTSTYSLIVGVGGNGSPFLPYYPNSSHSSSSFLFSFNFLGGVIWSNAKKPCPVNWSAIWQYGLVRTSICSGFWCPVQR
jgi:hypothetical protein